MKLIFILFTLLTLNAMASKSGDITYEYGNAKYEGFYINKGKKAPLVILMHDWDGLTKYEKERAKMLSQLGYSVFALDLFGKGVRPTEVKAKKQHTGELYKDRQKMQKLMAAAINEAQRLGLNTKNAVAMGYCFGGAAVLELARSGYKLKGFASFHGGLNTPDGQNYKSTQGEILVLHGAADSMISMDQFASLSGQLEKAKVKNEMISYGGAPHAFTVFNSPSYRKYADEQSWASFKAFLGRLTRL